MHHKIDIITIYMYSLKDISDPTHETKGPSKLSINTIKADSLLHSNTRTNSSPNVVNFPRNSGVSYFEAMEQKNMV